MKVLYAIQGTGNGHVARAAEIIPHLKKRVNLDLLISGTESDIALPFNIKYKLRGLSFTFGKSGGINIWESYKKLRSKELLGSIKNFPAQDYDLILNDFEPVSAWSARQKFVPCVSLSHQAAVISEEAPKPTKGGLLGKSILKHYAPAHFYYGFHFEEYNEQIYTPIIRQKVRELKASKGDHFVVYLPAYSDQKIYDFLKTYPNIPWKVFSKHSNNPYQVDNVSFHPVSDDLFVREMASSKGVMCGAGFETPAEAIFLRKKLLVVPMKGQFEQQCNAMALEKMGVPVVQSLSSQEQTIMSTWLDTESVIEKDYPDKTEGIVEEILSRH